ncbi:protein of unknown function (plasmid) [Cupriavidus taiwanensis]|uniref:Uncharacterized protein n=1 Tax=Cupriavidus taiwanensis TaxID=164546 RepID=A0A7Z7JE56_9BURK|nr:protein of unknown function [Cupriavidus taiwanensis]SOZ11393.1 protein of unknown function [Cupriavidus taiwanensis]SOZ42746.1 protein of unknown function [Cupriavidus taiwanensis]SPC21942.1 protein of unknown function [Cupriavidus taiwanensis]SPD55895.1 protein of unknown function [Cupriavidus taiwanensis]
MYNENLVERPLNLRSDLTQKRVRFAILSDPRRPQNWVRFMAGRGRQASTQKWVRRRNRYAGTAS